MLITDETIKLFVSTHKEIDDTEIIKEIMIKKFPNIDEKTLDFGIRIINETLEQVNDYILVEINKHGT